MQVSGVAVVGPDYLISFPAHALLIVEERLKEQEVEGVQMPEGMSLDELVLRVLIAAALTSRG
jgi:hypothetical protein